MFKQITEVDFKAKNEFIENHNRMPTFDQVNKMYQHNNASFATNSSQFSKSQVQTSQT